MAKAKFETKRVLIMVLGFCTGFVIWIFFIMTSEDTLQNDIKVLRTVLKDHSRVAYNYNTSKKILYVTSKDGYSDWNIGEGNKPFRKQICRVQNCFLTTNANKLKIEDFDALLFHESGMDEVLDTLPFTIRNPKQKYIFSSSIPPINGTYENQDKYRHLFNWTMSYRRKSTFPYPAGRVMHIDPLQVTEMNTYLLGYLHYGEGDTNRPTRSALLRKRKLVAWYVNDCINTESHREQYISLLEKHIQIDIYGKCGTLRCTPKNDGQSCLSSLAEDYKFILAFESQLCTDYVSDTIFSVLEEQTVAVVMGGVNYAALLPPLSYIDVSDFKTAKDLANYLLYLDTNTEEYLKYFEWKNTWFVDYRPPLCALCEALNEKVEKESIIDLNVFTNTSGCKSGLDTLFMMQSIAQDLAEKNEERQKMLQLKHNFTELRIQEKIHEIFEN